MKEEGTGASEYADSVLVVAEATDHCGEAFRIARQLRETGTHVELDVVRRSLREALRYAGEQELKRVIMIDSQGKQTSYNVE